MVSSITSFHTLHFYLLMIHSLLKGAFKSPQFSDSRKEKCIAKKEVQLNCPVCLKTDQVRIYMWSEQHIWDSSSDKITDCPHCRASEETQVRIEGCGGAMKQGLGSFFSVPNQFILFCAKCQFQVSRHEVNINGMVNLLQRYVRLHIQSIFWL